MSKYSYNPSTGDVCDDAGTKVCNVDDHGIGAWVVAQLHKAADYDTISVRWGIEDVKECAAQRWNCAPSDDQCREVLRRVKTHHDATVGVNWDVISYHIGEVSINTTTERIEP